MTTTFINLILYLLNKSSMLCKNWPSVQKSLLVQNCLRAKLTSRAKVIPCKTDVVIKLCFVKNRPIDLSFTVQPLTTVYVTICDLVSSSSELILIRMKPSSTMSRIPLLLVVCCSLVVIKWWRKKPFWFAEDSLKTS